MFVSFAFTDVSIHLLMYIGEHIKGGGFGSDDVGKASIYCDGLIECSITSANECLELISMAESHRVIRETHR